MVGKRLGFVSYASERYRNQKKSSSNSRKLLKERIDNANQRRKLTAEESKRLTKLESVADKFSR